MKHRGDSINISVKTDPNETAMNADFHFHKSMETKNCHSNQRSYLIGTKNTIIHFPQVQLYNARCVINMEKIGLTVSVEM